MKLRCPGPRERGLYLLLLLGVLVTSGWLAACTPDAASSVPSPALSRLPTLDPAQAATLTAWPTPPSLLTRPPTSTALPQPLWTAAPQPSREIPSPAPTALAGRTATVSATQAALLPGAAAPQPSTLPGASAPGAPPGSRPPAVRLLIPKLGLDLPVVEIAWDVVQAAGTWQAVWQTADGAAGHHRDSANPGETGNVVLSGHHNTRGEVFRQVSQIGLPESVLGAGDELILVAQDGARYTYRIVDWQRFQVSGLSADQQAAYAQWLRPTPDATLTLVTCWPYESNTHRVLVSAKLRP